jgi:hypothetical protein
VLEVGGEDVDVEEVPVQEAKSSATRVSPTAAMSPSVLPETTMEYAPT